MSVPNSVRNILDYCFRQDDKVLFYLMFLIYSLWFGLIFSLLSKDKETDNKSKIHHLSSSNIFQSLIDINICKPFLSISRASHIISCNSLRLFCSPFLRRLAYESLNRTSFSLLGLKACKFSLIPLKLHFKNSAIIQSLIS